MGNIGRPSAGCYTCRRRKIKCDQTRPGCKKCQTYGQKCPGYRKESDILFVCQNEAARRLAVGSISDSEFDEETSSESPLSLSKYAASATSNASPPPSKALSGCRSTESLCLFLASFVIDTAFTGFPGHLEFLPNMLKEQGHPRCFDLALSAVASANYATRIKLEKYPSSACEAYAKAIQATNDALLDPAQQLEDGTLLAVWLLSLYEIIVGASEANYHSRNNAIGWQTHVSGMAEILRLRGPQQFKTRRGQSLFRLVHGQIKVNSLFTGKTPPLESVSWIMQLYRSPQNLNKYVENSTRMSLYIYHASRLTNDMRELMHDSVPDGGRLMNLLKEVSFLDKEPETWIWSQDYWNPVFKSSADLSGNDFNTTDAYRCFHIYKSFHTMVMWNFFRTSRILLHTACIDCLSKLLQSSVLGDGIQETKYINASIQIIQSMATDIVNSIGFALGDIDSEGNIRSKYDNSFVTSYGGLSIMFAVRTVRTNQFVTEDHRKAGAIAKYRIENQLGICGLNR